MQIGFLTGDNISYYDANYVLKQGLQWFLNKVEEISPHFSVDDLDFREMCNSK